MYKCPFYWIFGIPCPGCGMTRAIVCLLRGDIRGVLAMHPLAITLPFFAAAFIFGSRKIRHYASVIMIVLFIAVYAARMIMYFPSSEPMVFNEASVLGRILDIIMQQQYN